MMTDLKNDIVELYYIYAGQYPTEITQLPASGGDRKYFRVHERGKKLLATYGNDIHENEQFIYLTDKLYYAGLNVPKVLFTSDDRKIYFQSDDGEINLLEYLSLFPDQSEKIMLNVTGMLVDFQMTAFKKSDLNRLGNPGFGIAGAMADLHYFRNFFLDQSGINYNREKLFSDFLALSILISRCRYKTFMYRDFQSRNIMVDHERLTFIDYQGGRIGPGIYDAISFAWQARLGLNELQRNNLLLHYCEIAGQKTGLNPQEIMNDKYPVLIVRLLQVLGAYGRRGLLEKKPHFIQSISPAIDNLAFASGYCNKLNLNYLSRVLTRIITNKKEILCLTQN